ncbi:MAG: GGDEF domain-containing protein [Brevinematales bacterium]|nr:GGDEF domain-containing protein [Brevinematales bacterium]
MNKDISKNYLAEIISIFILCIILFLSAFFIYYEKELYDQKVHTTCKNIITGIESIAREAILQNEVSYIADYVKSIKENKENSITKIFIYNYDEEKKLKLFFASEKNMILPSITNQDYHITTKDNLIYYENIKWTIKNKSYQVGLVEVHFDKNILYKTYYHSRNYLISVISISIILILIFVFLNISLSKELKKTIEIVRMLSMTDELTKIFNRKKINQSITEEINRAKRYNEIFSIIMFDIDHFKKINDTFGHDIGDEVLKNITRIVGAQLRITDIFGRWGGEEFIIISPKTQKEEAVHLAERIRQTVEQFSFPVVKNVSCSLGVTEWTKEDDEKTLLKRVDEALYEAKESGRNRVIVK